MIKANQYVFEFDDDLGTSEYSLYESIDVLKNRLSDRFEQETSNSFRVSLNSHLDLCILCLSLDEENTKCRYVVQTLAKNNTLKSLECFDYIEIAIEHMNNRLAFYA